jgi:hypothetical protein
MMVPPLPLNLNTGKAKTQYGVFAIFFIGWDNRSVELRLFHGQAKFLADGTLHHIHLTARGNGLARSQYSRIIFSQRTST